jgi:YggT family protein
MITLLCNITLAYEVILIARALLSWFPLQPGGAMARVSDVLARVTEPVLAPVRRVVPRVGMFDISFLIVLLGLQIVVRGLILRC